MGVSSIGRGRMDAVAEQTPLGIRLGVGVVALVFGTALADSIPGHGFAWRFGAIAMVVAVFAGATVDWVATAAIVIVGWLIADGFVQNRLGDLSWSRSVDLRLAAVLVGAGAGGLAAGAAARRLRQIFARRRAWTQWSAMLRDGEGSGDD